TTEGNEQDELIGLVTAVDSDSGVNAELSYSIIWPNNQGLNPFIINARGEIRARMTLDRESRPEGFQFTVLAKDNGVPSLSALAKVEVALIDVNDCSPTFTQGVYHFTVEEEIPFNMSNAYVIGQVKATDCDIGNNAQILYQLEATDAPFQVTLSIYEDINCKVAKIEAIDKDIERNGEIRFKLANDVPRGMFALNPESGELTLKRRLTVEEAGIIPLRILAIDNGLKPRTATTTIEILAADVPATKPAGISGNLDYSEQPNTFVGNLRVNANKFIIVCIVVITLIICLILAAVICVVSRKGCAAWTGAPTTSVRNQKQIHLVSHSNGGLPITEPVFSTAPDMEAFITKETPSIGYSEPSKYFSNAYHFHDQWETAISQDGRICDNPLANQNASEFYA
ncbi:cadherin domain protein, partial [Opisthorchis viverrini]